MRTKEYVNPLKAGDVIHNGSEVFVFFFRVLGFTASGKSAVIQQVEQVDVTVDEIYPTGKQRRFIPLPDNLIGDPVTRRILFDGYVYPGGPPLFSVSLPKDQHGMRGQLSRIWEGNPVAAYHND